jgi:CMP-N-acetylneuraminic acid synthetase
MNNLCTICARSGSKGVPNKNIKKIAGKPLIQHTIEQAKKSKIFSDIIVSSDCKKILKIDEKLGVYTLKRTNQLSKDFVGKVDVIRDAAIKAQKMLDKKFDNVIDLDVTSPLRQVSDIHNSFKKFRNGNYQNLITGCVARKNPYFNMIEIKKNILSISKRTNKKIYSRQKSPQVFEMNASIYIWKNKALMNKSNLVTSKTAFYEMPEERSIDIDTMLDWKIVSFLMEKK